MSRRCSANRSPSRPPVPPMPIFFFFAISASYAIADIGGGACEVISNLDGSFGSRYLINVMNERTCFVSCAGALESIGSFHPHNNCVVLRVKFEKK